MFDRGQSNEVGSGKRLSWYRKAVWSMLIFLCVEVIAGCSITPSSTTAIRRQPSPTEVTQPFHSTIKTFDEAFTVTLDITPNHSGPNVFMVRVVDNHTNKMAIDVLITLYTTMQDMPMGTDSIILHADGKGQFSAASDNLSMAGQWAIGIAIQTPDHTIHKAGVILMTPI
jgi:copper transport protein